MDQNPYAPPTSEYIASGATATGSPEAWDIGEVLQMGWDIIKLHWPLLVTVSLISQFAPQIILQLPALVQLLGLIEPDPIVEGALTGASVFIGLLSNAFFLPGQLRIYLALSRGENAELGMLFSGADRFFPILGMTLLYGLGISLGTFLCLVPGVILGVGWWLAQYYVVDQELGPIDSLKAAWRLTTGQRLNLFVLGLLSALLYVFGVALCCVGTLLMVPMYYLASTIVYLRLTGQLNRSGPIRAGEGQPAGPGADLLS